MAIRKTLPSSSSSADADGDSNAAARWLGWRILRSLGWLVVGLLAGTGVLLGVGARWLSVSSADTAPKEAVAGTNNNNDHALVLLPSERRNGTALVPPELLDAGIYQESDFVNAAGRSPPFWGFGGDENSGAVVDPSNGGFTWGPCFATDDPVDWSNGYSPNDNSTTMAYEYLHRETGGPGAAVTDRRTAGKCRPGFLIIGAGKCGTSSLYHYLVAHPRVAPAYSKQIHYFIYGLNRPLSWYYDWFPTAETYLKKGTLMTGEASPGYLPYPKAVHAVQQRLPGGAKILAVGRDPLARMHSSYKYNYVAPTLEWYREHGFAKHGIARHQNDTYYAPYLFSFEDFVRTELEVLRDCLHGFGPSGTTEKWSKEPWARKVLEARAADETEAPALVDLDGVCYPGGKTNKPQWRAMMQEHPERVIPRQQAFLVQAFLGRSLYVLPLEWWYAVHSPEDLVFVCTEELSDPRFLAGLAEELGLPPHDFSAVVAEGAFNAGGHKGYDEATPWDQLQAERDREASRIPLSPELRAEVLAFVEPFNERLFSLVGKRCNWTQR